MVGRLSSAEARERVLVAARELAVESGMSALTIDAVSNRSAVAKTTIYRSWPTVEELRIETVGSLIAELPTPDTGDLLADLEHIAAGFERAVESGMRPLMLSVLEAETRDERLVAIREDLMAANADPLSAAIRAAVDRGDLPTDTDVDLASILVRGPLFVYLVVENRTPTIEQRRQLLRAAIAGMAEVSQVAEPGH